MAYSFKPKNTTQMLLAITALKGLGYKPDGSDDKNAMEMARCWHDRFDRTLNVWPEHKEFGGRLGNDVALSKNLETFIKSIASHKSPVVIKLNNTYSAQVSAKGVTVGCQTFSLAKVRELAKAVEKVRK